VRKIKSTNIKTGKEIISNNQIEFAKRYNLDPSGINMCIKGKIKYYKGWTFKYLEE
jgi:hypothetical protein